MKGRHWLALGLLTIATAGICSLILTDWLPILRGPAWLDGEWRWPFSLRPYSRWWLPLLAAGAMVAASAWWLRVDGRRKRTIAAGLLLLVAASLFLQGSVVYADRVAVAAEVVDRTLAPQTSGYFWTAAEIEDMGSLLRNYPANMEQFESEHARTHPPGLVLGNWLLIRVMENTPRLSARLADWIRPLRCTDLWLLEMDDQVLAALSISSMMAPLAAALLAPLAYIAARQIADEWDSRLATIMVATLPALVLFAPLADQLLAFLSTLCLLVLFLAHKRRSTLLYIVTGFLVSLAAFTSLGSAALLIVVATVFVAGTLTSKDPWQNSLKWAGALILGLGIAWIAYWLIWGVAPWKIAQTAMGQHYELVTSRRRYGVWLGFNLVDLLLFSGLMVIFGFGGASLNACRKVLGHRLSAFGSLSLGLIFMIGVLLLSGTTRGEVGRIWLFFLPLMAISAGLYLAKWFPDRRAALLMVVLQLAIVVSLGVAWRPVEAVIVTDQRPAMPAVEGPVTELGADFAQAVTLSGLSMSSDVVAPGGTIELSLIWAANGPTRRPYTVFAHLVDAEGMLLAQHDGWPVHGRWPPTCWLAGETIVDPVRIPIPGDARPGEYELFVGLYDTSNGQRLNLNDGSDSVRVSTIRVAVDG